MAQIFISYAREDFKLVSELRQRLKNEGFTTWMDKVDLLAGQRWRPAIEQAVRESDFFVLCLSNRTVSKRRFVQREIKMALDLWQEMLADDIFLIPVLLEHIEPEEIPVSIREIGWVFWFEEDGWDDLMRALKYGMKQRAIDERDECKKEEDTRQAAAAEQRLREETARLQKENAEIERKLHEVAVRSQQEETARLKRDREAAELRRQTEAAQQQEERADQQEREALEQKRIERDYFAPIPRSRPIYPAGGKGFQLWLVVAGAILLVGLGYWAWNAFRTAEVLPQTSDPPITTTNTTPAPGNGQTFEFETVRLNASGGEIERQKLRAEYFIENLGNGVSLGMVKIPGGSFAMGSFASEAQRDSDEGPSHSVNVSSFWMGKYEITQMQWQALMNANPSNFKDDRDLPVEQVSWNDAQEFLKKLNALPNLKGKNYRLPTEAEWEYAARAGTTTPFAFGETITPQIVNYDGTYPYANAAKGLYRQKTVPIGSTGVANMFGLFDMHGNVWEWCQDIYVGNYNKTPRNGTAFLSGGASGSRVVRGGSWYDQGASVRSALRHVYSSSFTDYNLGFRVVCARTQNP